MNRIKTASLFLCAALTFSFCACTGNPGSSEPQPDAEGENFWELTSPDGSVKVRTELNAGKATYSVYKDGTSVVEASELGLETDLNDFTQNLSFKERTRDEQTVSYTTISGKKSSVETAYKELVLSFAGASDVTFDIVFRAYNDGYAFRYRLEQEDGEGNYLYIDEENTAFNLPEGSIAYITTTPDYETRFCYEESYDRKRASNLYGVISGMPVLYKTDDDVWSMITESELIGSNYRGSFLEGTQTGFVTKPAYTQTTTVVASYPFVSPWRVGVVGGLDTMVESTLVEDVYGETEYWKPDNYDELSAEEQAIYNYDWVETPKAAFTWLQLGSGSQQNWAENKKYIAYAHEHGWDWFLIDAGWIPYDSTSLASFLDMMNYAKSLGVHMICWAHSYVSLGTQAMREENIQQWKEWGFEGLKVDFFDGLYDTTELGLYGESQYTLQMYEDLYQYTAENQMLLFCHGANKPTGERRVYPHLMSREGIRGGEYKKDIYMTDCVTFPFTRASVGPSDWILSVVPFGDNTTVGSQLAMHIVYETGIMVYGDSPEHYDEYKDAVDFLDEIPVVFDDIKYLSGEPQDSCVIGREKDGVWYVGGMSVFADTMEVDLSAICDPDKEYEVTILSDGATYLDIVKTVKTVKGDEILGIEVIDNGGFVLSVKEK